MNASQVWWALGGYAGMFAKYIATYHNSAVLPTRRYGS